MRLLSQSGFALLLCAALSVVLVGCGRKPSLSDLKAPEPTAPATAPEAPAAAATLDGKSDGLEPVATAKPKRGFFLDFLL